MKTRKKSVVKLQPMDRATVDMIRERVDLVELVSRTVKLKGSGRSQVGLCPFCDDMRGTLSVAPHLRHWQCFKCGAKGDCYTWVMIEHKLSFPDAVRAMAREVGAKEPERIPAWPTQA